MLVSRRDLSNQSLHHGAQEHSLIALWRGNGAASQKPFGGISLGLSVARLEDVGRPSPKPCSH